MKSLTAFAITFLCISSAFAQHSELVQLGKAQSKTITGSVKGKGTMDYRLPVGAGQAVSVTLRSQSLSVNFNFNPPKSDVSLFIGSISGRKMASRVIPSRGEYIIRVYQMGAAASANRTSKFTLEITVKGTALKPLSGARDAKIAGTPFHAQGPVPCVLPFQKDLKTCEAYVIRYGNGSATVEFRAGQWVRRVLFLKGKPISSDSFEKLTFSRVDDSTVLRLGDSNSEQYTVVDAFIFGG